MDVTRRATKVIGAANAPFKAIIYLVLIVAIATQHRYRNKQQSARGRKADRHTWYVNDFASFPLSCIAILYGTHKVAILLDFSLLRSLYLLFILKKFEPSTRTQKWQ